jgi:hypothetical protein
LGLERQHVVLDTRTGAVDMNLDAVPPPEENDDDSKGGRDESALAPAVGSAPAVT